MTPAGPSLANDPTLKRGMITISVMLATIMQALDSTIANVALPHMQGTLSATQDQMTWVLTSYIVASAIMIPLTGWLAGRFGRKRVFLISIAGFTISSALCGIAMTLPQIVLFRLLQGMCGAALVPLSQAILFDINPPQNFGRAMSIWGVGVTMGPILGPALGGWLTEDYSWRWVFYINVPIGIFAFLGLLLSLPETERQDRPFDFFGFLTLSLGIGSFQMMLDRGELKDWFGSSEIIGEAIAAALGFYLFFVHTLSFRRPFISPEIFKDRNFVVANIFIFLVGVILFATLALLPPMLQENMNYPVITTGLVTAPRGLGTMVAMMLVGRIINKFDPRAIMCAGLILTAFSLWQMTRYSLLMNMSPIVISGLTQGFGIGLTYVTLSTVAFATLPGALRTEGAAFFNLLRNVGASIGISIVQALLTSNTQILHAEIGRNLTRYNAAADPAYAANHIDIASRASILALNGMVTNQAAMIAYIDDFKLMMLLTLGVMPLLLVLRRGHKATKEEQAMVME